MLRKFSVMVAILFLIVIILAYLNYDRLNQVEKELREKQVLLEQSGELIEQQEKSVAQLEDKIKEIAEKEDSAFKEYLAQTKEILTQEQLEDYQKSLQELSAKLEQALQQNKIESSDLVQLNEEKNRLEGLMEEKEAQWQAKEKENQQIIASLKGEIQQYESEIGEVNNKILDFQKYFELEKELRINLEKEIAQFEKRINVLQDKLALAQDDEIKVKEISQLQADKKKLEEEVGQKTYLLDQIQNEYQLLKNQLLDYEQKMVGLAEKVSMMEEEGDVLDEIRDHLVQLNEEKNRLEGLMEEKEAQWQAKEKENQQIIASLKGEIQQYDTNLQEIGQTVVSLKEDLEGEMILKEVFQKEINDFSSEIDQLRKEVVRYQDLEQSYQETISQLQSGKEILQRKLEEDVSQIGYQEYQDLLSQLNIYQNQLEDLRKELSTEKKQEESTSTAQFVQMQKEITNLENLLVNKEAEWKKQNQETTELITYLKDQLEAYRSEIEAEKVDRSLFREEISAQIESQQEKMDWLAAREDQIAKLTVELEEYAKRIENYETMIEDLRLKLQQRENLSFYEQQMVLQDLKSFIEERDRVQDNINQCRIQISQLQAEILQLQKQIAEVGKKEQQYYEVKSGDCLWKIAKDKYDEGVAWIKIFNANQKLIENPDLIYPYQQFVLPE